MSVDEVVNWFYTDEELPTRESDEYLVAVYHFGLESVFIALWSHGKFFREGQEMGAYAWAELPEPPPSRATEDS